jgi:signal transduction histidine kinase
VDIFKVRQVIRNLLSNAFKFTPPGGQVTCTVQWRQQCADTLILCDKGFVRIEVQDTGVGMTRDNQDRLFKEMVQFDAKANQGGVGSGLGLWLSKRLVVLNGGTIGVQSDGPGQGSTFFVEFPHFSSSSIALLQNPATSCVMRSRRRFC